MKGFVRKPGAAAIEAVGAGIGTTREVLISSEEGPNFALRKFSMEAGGGMPKHTNTVEHEQYVLRGSAEVGIGDEVFTVSAGDSVYIPKEVPHWYKASDGEPFEFLCIVPNGPDKITIIDE